MYTKPTINCVCTDKLCSYCKKQGHISQVCLSTGKINNTNISSNVYSKNEVNNDYIDTNIHKVNTFFEGNQMIGSTLIF